MKLKHELKCINHNSKPKSNLINLFSELSRPYAEEAYGNPDAVTDELVNFILMPGLQPGAAEVFLDFISYSGGQGKGRGGPLTTHRAIRTRCFS